MRSRLTGLTSALLAMATPCAAQGADPAAPVEIATAGPRGPLAGTLILPAPDRPVVLILPGSGPTDRDGNSPLGIRASSYRLLAEALARRGIGSVRADKRGLFGSKDAVADPNAVTVADYARDAGGWIDTIRKRTGRPCVWLAGHSEGGLIALVTAQGRSDICGVVLIAAPGRKLGDVLREQLRANPANAPLLPAAMAAIDTLEAGGSVDAATLPPPLLALFNPAVQPFLRDLMAQSPTALAAALKVPLLVIAAERDIQVPPTDGEALAGAKPGAVLVRVADANHVLKRVTSDDRAANLATYADPSLPVVPEIVDAIVAFVGKDLGSAR
ncbi:MULTISPECIES: alpha/beta hydrolase [unclassified Sphingomonas]|uniref:alpha/beta hydrolase n=1 Tax=unclassified Sphingomonas TaxID=196159 RepID=UPI000833170E|nr:MULTISPECIES: alpha/beta hydrolase [unclassified Sphingomonas]